MRICGLCLVLFKRTSEKTNKILASEVKKVKVSAPRKSLLEKAKENEEKEKEKEKSDDEKSDEDAAFVVPTGKLQAMENAHAQLTALLSFKEALCTGRCTLIYKGVYQCTQ